MKVIEKIDLEKINVAKPSPQFKETMNRFSVIIFLLKVLVKGFKANMEYWAEKNETARKSYSEKFSMYKLFLSEAYESKTQITSKTEKSVKKIEGHISNLEEKIIGAAFWLMNKMLEFGDIGSKQIMSNLQNCFEENKAATKNLHFLCDIFLEAKEGMLERKELNRTLFALKSIKKQFSFSKSFWERKNGHKALLCEKYMQEITNIQIQCQEGLSFKSEDWENIGEKVIDIRYANENVREKCLDILDRLTESVVDGEGTFLVTAKRIYGSGDAKGFCPAFDKTMEYYVSS